MLTFFLGKDAYAVTHFADGVRTEHVDIAQAADIYFGGKDTLPGTISVCGPTWMKIFTRTLQENLALDIYGGSRHGINGEECIINGDVYLSISNTRCRDVFGGSMGNGTVNGVINVFLYNSYLTQNLVGVSGTVANGANIYVDGSRASQIHGCDGSGILGVGSGPIACRGDVKIQILNGSTARVVMGGGWNPVSSILGNVDILVENSTVDSILCTGDADIYGNATIRLSKGAVVNNIVYFNRYGTVKGDALIIVDGASINNRLIVGGESFLEKGKVVIKDGYISKLRVSGHAYPNAPAVPDNRDMSVEMFGGSVDSFEIGTYDGVLHKGSLFLHNGDIRDLTLGRDPTAGHVRETKVVLANISGGSIGHLKFQQVEDRCDIVFTPGGVSSIGTVERSPHYRLDSLSVEEGAQTCWGVPGTIFSIEAQDVDLSGKISIAEGSKVEISSGRELKLNGGTIEILESPANVTAPVLVINGVQGSSVKIDKPLALQLGHSYLYTNPIPVVQATGSFGNNPNLLATQNRTGFIWSDTSFDPITNIWSVQNVRVSEGYYGYSSLRKTSVWLQQHNVLETQRRAEYSLLKNKTGFWGSVQDGYEGIGVTIGTSKLFWATVATGYDMSHAMFDSLGMLYGCSVGASIGKNTLSNNDPSKNMLVGGGVSGYVGVKHSSGVYGTGVFQFSLMSMRVKNPEFSFSQKKWTENVPTESVELGWAIPLGDVVLLTPRGQMFLSHVPKKEIKISNALGTDTLICTKTTAMRTSVGIKASFAEESVLSVRCGVDFIKGVSGEYTVESRILSHTVKDKNDNKVIRTSLGCTWAVTQEHFLGLDLFGDILDEKGIGGQVAFSYKF